MNVQPIPTAICRTPAFAITADLFSVWGDLKSHIKLSSPNFYTCIAHTQPEDWDSLPPKVRFTLWKYFNRSVFRATPFGGFAAFSVVGLSDQVTTELKLQQKMQLHRFLDWDQKADLNKKALQKKLLIRKNATCYKVGDELRYISYTADQFRLTSLELFPELRYILKLTHKSISVEMLAKQLERKYDLATKSSYVLIKQLVDAQVLLHEYEPNITGEDYFSRIGCVNNLFGEAYILAERSVVNGVLEEKLLEELPAFFEFAAKIQGAYEQSGLKGFRAAFLKKFENAEIPLAIALDPELGVGYQGLEQAGILDQIIDFADIKKSVKEEKQQVGFGAFERFLLEGIIKNEKIELSDFAPADQTEATRLPNSFNALIHLYQNRVVLSSAGGCTATNLNGRFSLASSAVEKLGKEIANIECKSNPEIIFFEIAYQAEKHIDNVNRRKHFYNYEFPILSWSEGTNVLSLDDLWVSVHNEEIMIRSAKLNKRVIPRLSSAYNYSRSDLSLYRFLCDLQHQGLHNNLYFKLWDFLPNLSKYPRMEYKGIIISPAKWRIPDQLVQNPQDDTLQDWLKMQGIDTRFKCGRADHVLCVDPQSEMDRWAFLQYLNQHREEEVYVWEALIDKDSQPKDEQENRYFAEFVINFIHRKLIYEPAPTNKITPHFPIPTGQFYLPTEEWVYVEIYSHPSRTNFLLTSYINKFVHQHRKAIQQWFFIRYNNPTSHIRFRFKVQDPAKRSSLLSDLNRLLKPKVREGFIHDIEIKTYYREYLRYGHDRIDLVEAFFHRDSIIILEKLKANDEALNYFATTLWLMDKLSALAFNNIADQLNFAERYATIFAKEMHWQAEHFKKINQTYRSVLGVLNQSSQQLTIDLPQRRILLQIMKLCTNYDEKVSLLGDLIHMHVNRLFSDEQRKQEALLYQFLLQYLKTKKAISFAQQQYSA